MPIRTGHFRFMDGVEGAPLLSFTSRDNKGVSSPRARVNRPLSCPIWMEACSVFSSLQQVSWKEVVPVKGI